MLKTIPRALSVSFVLWASTILAGLLIRFAPLHLPMVVAKYGGSALWALMLYWMMSTLFARWRIATVVLATGGLATAVECFKLYRSPGMDAFRHTLPGILLLGRIFSAQDLVAYWTAIIAGGWVDRRLRLHAPFARKDEDSR